MTIRKEKLFPRSLVCLAVATLISSQASAQLHTPYQPEHKWLKLAGEQFQQGQYRSAWQSAKTYLQENKNDIYNRQITGLDEAAFYVAAAALRLDDAGCVDSAEVFIRATANPAYKQRMAFNVAQYYFRNNMPGKAVPYYEMAGIDNLSNREIANAKFELAYCYFNLRQFDKATPLLQGIKELDGKYYVAGNYYFGLLAYNQGNYADALQSFQRIENEKEYKDIVPYYIAEIYYFMGEKGKALEEAKRLLKRSDKLFYDNELHLLAAQVLFENKNYREALPYFEYYYTHTDRIRKEELYEMAYCYYDGAEWGKAIEKFKQLSNSEDSLGQTAMYLLGDCYLKTNDLMSARNAFSICADMQFNQSQREAALLLAAKLSYELGYNDEALTRVNDLLSSFPESAHKDEAKTLLSDLLIKTNRYQEAYNIMQEVTNRDEVFRHVYQKVTYGYAMQQLQSGNMQMADGLLDESLQNSVDDSYAAVANFWKGEIAYRMLRFADATSYTERFVAMAGRSNKVEALSTTATLQNAYVNLGYAAMEQRNFAAAQTYFSKAQGQVADPAMALNAVIREADAVFMQKNYSKAIALYDKVISANSADADYARYQKAIVLGVTGKRAEKITLLQGLINKTPASAYAYDARYEQALAYIEEDKYQQAITVLQPLTTAQEKRNLAPKAWMKTGFAYQQLHMNDKAIEAYKHIVAEYPATEERAAALDALKSLYIETNEPDAYAQVLKENNIAVEDDNSLDSAYYSAAENQFAAQQWDKARTALGAYLSKYPHGVFANKAHYYKAESHYQLNETKEALAEYDAVLNNNWSEFSERSATKAASIAFLGDDHAKAITYYGMLRNSAMNKSTLQDAYKGLMNSSYILKRYAEAAAYADTVLSLPELPEQANLEATYIKAMALQQDNKAEQALPIFQKLAASKKQSVAAQANYYVAEMHFKNGKLKEAEETANATIKLASGNDNLTVKTYILLADILTKQNDFFNAKALLQSIVKNTKNDDLKAEASRKLEEVKAQEKKQSKLSEE